MKVLVPSVGVAVLTETSSPSLKVTVKSPLLPIPVTLNDIGFTFWVIGPVMTGVPAVPSER